jgi:uncharacterized protein DUF4331
VKRRTMLASALAALALPAAALVANASDHNEPQSVNVLEFNGSDRNNPSHLDRINAGDIYGLYAWSDEVSGTVPVILSLPGPVNGFPQVPLDDEQRAEQVARANGQYRTGPYPWAGGDFDEGAPNAYDPNVVYGLHFDPDNGFISRQFSRAEHSIFARFGYDRAKRAWGVLLQGLPDANGDWQDDVVVPVGRDFTTAGGVRIRAGLFDDPFYFDLDGFFDSLEPYGDPAARMAYHADRDTIAGRNSRCIVIEIPARWVRKRSLLPPWGLSNDLNVWATSARLGTAP